MFGVTLSVPVSSAESEWRSISPDDQADPSTPLQDPREEREEREGEGDDQDDELDGSRHVAWASARGPIVTAMRASFPCALVTSAPDKSHHSLDPKPPRRG